MSQPLSTDTVVQQAVATELGNLAETNKAQIESFLGEVQALQAHLQGEAGMATQSKALQLTEVGHALMAELNSISERVGIATTGYLTSDSDGASHIGTHKKHGVYHQQKNSGRG